MPIVFSLLASVTILLSVKLPPRPSLPVSVKLEVDESALVVESAPVRALPVAVTVLLAVSFSTVV